MPRRLRICVSLILLVSATSNASPPLSREKRIDLYLGNAQLYYEARHYRSAIAQVTKVLELDPQNQNARFLRAMSHLHLKSRQDVQISLVELEELAQQDFGARQFRVWLGLGMARAAAGDLHEARVRELDGRIADDPRVAPELRPTREEARRERDRLWKASIVACQKVLSCTDLPRARNDPTALFTIFRNYSLLGDHAHALEYEQRYLGVIEASRRQWEKAIKTLPASRELFAAKLRRTDKQEIAVREAMADTLYELGKREEAIKQLDRSIELDPERAEPYLSRAQVLRKLDRHAEAVPDLRKFIEKTSSGPEDPDARKALELLRDSERKAAKD